MKINSETVVPIGWVISGMAAILAVTISATFWVSTVNTRLSRIEDKLGIVPYNVSAEEKAFGAEKKK